MVAMRSVGTTCARTGAAVAKPTRTMSKAMFRRYLNTACLPLSENGDLGRDRLVRDDAVDQRRIGGDVVADTDDRIADDHAIAQRRGVPDDRTFDDRLVSDADVVADYGRTH